MENDYYKRYEPFFGSWYIKRFIGKGSYGKVFEVERKDAFGTVYTGALKAITVPTSEDELEDLLANGMDRDSASTYFRNYAEGLNREIALMSRLKGHSNIVSYEDHDIQPHEDGMGWDMLIRMELLTPITIFQKANKPFTRRQVIQLGIDLCRALEVCQKYNIIHRDIKPANIFLSETGDFKLGVFGVARIASAATGASTRAGTVNYMAPEVFRGEKYTSNVDIYSLGLVMYQLLNANRMPLCPPYPQLMTPNQWEQANARRLSGASLLPPANADGRLAEIVLKACSPNSAERYEAPSLMRQALEAILYTEQETKDIYPEGDALPLPKTSKKNPSAPHPGTDGETENVWVKMREVGGESALAEPLPVTGTLTEKVPTKHELESECEKVPESVLDKNEADDFFQKKEQEKSVVTPNAASQNRKLLLAIGGVVTAVAFATGSLMMLSRDKGLVSAASASAEVPSESTSAELVPVEVESASKTEADNASSKRKITAKLIDSGSCGKNANWELYEDGSIYISGSGAIWDYELDYNKTPMTNVPWPKGIVKNVIIEDGITEIGDDTFWEYSTVNAVSIPDSVIRIGSGAFNSCELTSVEIPNSVQVIGLGAFAWSSLESVTIPGSVYLIQESFLGCASLKSVKIEEGVALILESAFGYCESLEEVTIPLSVSYIEAGAFQGCSSLKSVTISKACDVEENAFPEGVTINYYE